VNLASNALVVVELDVDINSVLFVPEMSVGAAWLL
jgi:hypothetical protein